jgi:hypothetical protein
LTATARVEVSLRSATGVERIATGTDSTAPSASSREVIGNIEKIFDVISGGELVDGRRCHRHAIESGADRSVGSGP